MIQEGAVEFLIQYHHQAGQNSSEKFLAFLSNAFTFDIGISMTGRLMDLNSGRDTSTGSGAIVNSAFQYVLREYYTIIWAFLFKHDYAFRVR